MSDGVRDVALQAYAACPFSVAQDYAIDYLRRAEAGTDDAEIRVPVAFWAGLIRRRVTISFGLHYDVVEAGRAHDEIRLRWTAGTRLLPDFRGTLRFRIAGKGTDVLIDGSYHIPFGILGRIFDSAAGRHLALASLRDLAQRIAASLVSSEHDWRKKLSSQAG